MTKPTDNEAMARDAEDFMRAYLYERKLNRHLTAERDYLKRRIAEEDERLANASLGA